MRNKKLLLLLFSGLFPFSAIAQYVLKEADVAFELFNYSKAIDLYEQGWKKKESLHAAERLAACYNFQNNYEQRESWAAIAAKWPGSPAGNTLIYAKALQGNSKYSEAKIQYNKYADQDKTLDPALKRMWLQSCDSAVSWMRRPGMFNIHNEKALNSSKSDWGALNYQGSIVFVSDRMPKAKDAEHKDKPFIKFDGKRGPNKTIYGWTGNPYLRLYTKKGTDSLALFALRAGTDYHIGPASFTADGQEIYFALTRIPKRLDYTHVEILKGKEATVNIEIYSSRKEGSGKWTAVVPFTYNKVNEYSVGDPFISADGQSLYFSSNMPGGNGGTDIYLSKRTDKGDWGLPINLKEVNTKGNERSPFFDSENNFYFSSDGRVGMGGLDIFHSRLVGDKISEPENLGYPINSPQDDFCFNTNTTNTGYFSSNRTGGLGSDDIYSFAEQEKVLSLKLQGVVYNKQTKMPLMNAIVTIDKTGGDRLLSVATDSMGKFSFVLQDNTDYGVKGNKTNFRSDERMLSTVGLKKSVTLERHLYLEPILIGKTIRLDNIYYDSDRANVRPDAAVELDKLVKVMKDNPTIWIELGSHTDSKGNDQYNQWLSQRRANSAAQYLIDKGIFKNRIRAKGYGESRLLNGCTNGVKCTEAEHQLNRRTEFSILH